MIPKTIILTTILAITINSAFSQNGKYCIEDFLWSSCYTFLPENRFEYEELMCVAQVVGEGYYEIKNDSIIFQYEPIDFFSNQLQLDKENEMKNKLVLKFDVYDYESKDKIDSIYVSVLAINEYKEYYHLTSSPLEIETQNMPQLITIGANYYSSYSFEIADNGIYHISLKLAYGTERHQYDPKNGTEKFQINLNENSITMTNRLTGQKLTYSKSDTLSNK